MGRKTIDYRIPPEDGNRDAGKLYVIREMPAPQAEKLAIRVFQGLVRSGVDLPEDAASSGMAGIAVMGFKALGMMSFADLEPILDEIMACVEIKPDPKNPAVQRPLIDDDVEEVQTRLKLRMAWFELTTGFSMPASPSKAA